MDATGNRQEALTGARPGSGSWPLVGTLGLLVAVSVLDNVVAPDLYLLWACLAIAALGLLARADGLHRRDVGLGPITGRAAGAAAALVAITAAAMVIGTRIPGIASAYVDDRVAGMGAGEVAFAALVRVPVGTALLEELAFRGVLLAMLARRLGTRWGVVGSSAAFGLWHLLPALGVATGNAAIGSALGDSSVVVTCIAMAAAALAGAFLCVLRLRFDHLIVPLALHATANSLAYVLAWLVAGG